MMRFSAALRSRAEIRREKKRRPGNIVRSGRQTLPLSSFCRFVLLNRSCTLFFKVLYKKTHSVRKKRPQLHGFQIRVSDPLPFRTGFPKHREPVSRFFRRAGDNRKIAVPSLGEITESDLAHFEIPDKLEFLVAVAHSVFVHRLERWKDHG